MISTISKQHLSTVGSVLLLLSITGQSAQAAPPVGNTPISAPLPTAPTSSASEPYMLGAGDQIQIDIFDAPEYSGDKGRFQVLVDGTLNLPLVGNVSVKGLTLKQAGSLLSQKYFRFFKRSIVTVTLLAPRPLSVTIAGEVNRPGSYSVSLAQQQQQNGQQTTGLQFPTLTSALKLAGGITQAADIKQIQVRRPQPGRPDQLIAIDLMQFLRMGDRNQDLVLRDGDTIMIPAASTINLAEANQVADANFAADQSQPIPIAVVGEVFRPGSYTVTGNTRSGAAGVPGTTQDIGNQPTQRPTVTRAIQIAGGIKSMADIRRIQLRRITRDGGEQTINIDLLKLLKDGDLRQDTILQAGDTIVIPTAKGLTPAEAAEIASASFSPDTIRVNVVGEVKQPGAVQVAPNTPLNQALLAAGGFDPRRARKNAVELIRLNPDGTVTKREVAIDFAQGINDRTNPALQNNDIIVVGRSGFTRFSDGVSNVLTPFGNAFSIFNFLNIFR